MEGMLSSYIVRTLDISSLVAKAEQIVARSGGRAEARKPASHQAALREHPRVQYFYYCDDREGITVRLFDEEISRSYADIFSRKSRVFFRAKKLGDEGGAVKNEIRGLWDEIQSRPTGLGVGVGSVQQTEDYFRKLNGIDAEPIPIQESVSALFEDFLSKFDPIRKSAPYGKTSCLMAPYWSAKSRHIGLPGHGIPTSNPLVLESGCWELGEYPVDRVAG